MKDRMRLAGLFGLMLAVLCSMGFGQDVETIDGVRVVHNGDQGRWGKAAPISLELIKTLGDINASDENVAFYMPNDIVFDSKGNWYILDSGNHRIQKFSPDGKYLDTIGGQGQGPGEMAYPASLAIDDRDYLYVSDPNNQRIQVLMPDGNEYKTLRLTHGQVGVVRLLSSGKIEMGGAVGFMRMGLEEAEAKALPKIMKVMDLDGNMDKEFGDQFDFKNMMLNRMGNQITFAVDDADNTFLVFPFQNRIEKYSADGHLLWRADRSLDYSMDPPKDKGKREVSGGSVSIRMPQMNRCSNGVAVDGKGRVWVLTLTRQMKEEEAVRQSISVSMQNGQRTMNTKLQGNTELQNTDMYKIQVYDTTGILLGDIPLDHFVDSIVIKNDRCYLIDRLRGTKIYEYKINEQ